MHQQYGGPVTRTKRTYVPTHIAHSWAHQDEMFGYWRACECIDCYNGVPPLSIRCPRCGTRSPLLKMGRLYFQCPNCAPTANLTRRP